MTPWNDIFNALTDDGKRVIIGYATLPPKRYPNIFVQLSEEAVEELAKAYRAEFVKPEQFEMKVGHVPPEVAKRQLEHYEAVLGTFQPEGGEGTE